MPVVRMNVGESPHHIVPGYACLNPRIIGDVCRIIKINKAIPRGPAEDGKGDRKQCDTDGYFYNEIGTHDHWDIAR